MFIMKWMAFVCCYYRNVLARFLILHKGVKLIYIEYILDIVITCQDKLWVCDMISPDTSKDMTEWNFGSR